MNCEINAQSNELNHYVLCNFVRRILFGKLNILIFLMDNMSILYNSIFVGYLPTLKKLYLQYIN